MQLRLVVLKFWFEGHGEADYILGVSIVRNRSKRFVDLYQDTYIQRILEHFHMQSCKPIGTLLRKAPNW